MKIFKNLTLPLLRRPSSLTRHLSPKTTLYRHSFQNCRHTPRTPSINGSQSPKLPIHVSIRQISSTDIKSEEEMGLLRALKEWDTIDVREIYRLIQQNHYRFEARDNRLTIKGQAAHFESVNATFKPLQELSKAFFFCALQENGDIVVDRKAPPITPHNIQVLTALKSLLEDKQAISDQKNKPHLVVLLENHVQRHSLLCEFFVLKYLQQHSPSLAVGISNDISDKIKSHWTHPSFSTSSAAKTNIVQLFHYADSHAIPILPIGSDSQPSDDFHDKDMINNLLTTNTDDSPPIVLVIGLSQLLALQTSFELPKKYIITYINTTSDTDKTLDHLKLILPHQFSQLEWANNPKTMYQCKLDLFEKSTPLLEDVLCLEQYAHLLLQFITQSGTFTR